MKQKELRSALVNKLDAMSGEEREALFSTLKERKRYVIERRIQGNTLRTIANELGICVEYTRQIEGQALRQLLSYKY